MKRHTYDSLLDVFGVAAGAAFGLVAIVTTTDVLMRLTGAGAINGLAELVEYLLFTATFLAAPWLLHQNGHVQVDFLINALPPTLRQATRRLADAIGLLVCLTILFYAVRVTHESWANHNVLLKTYVVPEWWFYAIVIVSMLLLTVEFIRRLRSSSIESAPPPDL